MPTVAVRPLWRRLFVVIAILGLLLGPARPAAAETIPVDDYWQRLAALQTQLSALAAQPPEVRAAVLAAAASAWSSVTAVTLPDGATVPVDHSDLVAALRGPNPDLADLTARVSALTAAHAAWPAPTRTAADLRSLQTILGRPEFNWSASAPNPLADLWNRFLTAVLRFLTRLVPAGVDLSFGGELLGWAFTALSLLLVTGIVAYALRGVLGGLVREVALPADAGLEAGALNPELAAQQAQRLAGQGDYRTAVRYLYLSALLSLEARGLLRYERTLTNREVLRRLADHPDLARRLRDVVDVFDRVWYGFQPLDAATYSQYAERVAALRQAPG